MISEPTTNPGSEPQSICHLSSVICHWSFGVRRVSGTALPERCPAAPLPLCSQLPCLSSALVPSVQYLLHFAIRRAQSLTRRVRTRVGLRQIDAEGVLQLVPDRGAWPRPGVQERLVLHRIGSKATDQVLVLEDAFAGRRITHQRRPPHLFPARNPQKEFECLACLAGTARNPEEPVADG